MLGETINKLKSIKTNKKSIEVKYIDHIRHSVTPLG